MVGWHHQRDGRESEQTPGVGDGQGGLACCQIHGLTKNRTRLKRLSSSSSTLLGFPCGLAGKESACSAGDLGSIPGLGRSPGEGKGYPLLLGASMGNPTCGKGHEEGDLAKGKG